MNLILNNVSRRSTLKLNSKSICSVASEDTLAISLSITSLRIISALYSSLPYNENGNICKGLKSRAMFISHLLLHTTVHTHFVCNHLCVLIFILKSIGTVRNKQLCIELGLENHLVDNFNCISF